MKTVTILDTDGVAEVNRKFRDLYCELYEQNDTTTDIEVCYDEEPSHNTRIWMITTGIRFGMAKKEADVQCSCCQQSLTPRQFLRLCAFGHACTKCHRMLTAQANNWATRWFMEGEAKAS